jgi:hypothetical protein
MCAAWSVPRYRTARATSRPLRVTVVGPPDIFADRTVTLLNGQGIDARKASPPTEGLGALRSRLDRIERGLATDVFLHMCGMRDLKRLQVWLGKLGIPTLILWIGSDVTSHAPQASRTVTADAWHWCVAPWLRDELAKSGIEADVVRITPPWVPEPLPALPANFSVLAYGVGDRGDLYGIDFIRALARRLPDVEFLLIGAAPAEPLPDNITALGWVDDVHEVMSRTTVYVRPTRHDGLSNLVLEALAHARYVLWTYPFPGVDTATTVDAAAVRLNELRWLHMKGRLTPNHDGRNAVLNMFEPAVVGEDTFQRIAAVVEQGWRRHPGGVQLRIALAARWALRALLRVERNRRASQPLADEGSRSTCGS